MRQFITMIAAVATIGFFAGCATSSKSSSHTDDHVEYTEETDAHAGHDHGTSGHPVDHTNVKHADTYNTGMDHNLKWTPAD